MALATTLRRRQSARYMEH